MTKQTKQPEREWEEDFEVFMEEANKSLEEMYDYGAFTKDFYQRIILFIRGVVSQAHQQGYKEALERIKNKVRELGPDVVIPGLLDTYIDKRRVIKILDDSKLKLDKPFNKKEFVRLANNVRKVLEEENRTRTGAYDATTRAGKKRFREMLRELVE